MARMKELEGRDIVLAIEGFDVLALLFEWEQRVVGVYGSYCNW